MPLPVVRDAYRGACPDGLRTPRNVLMFSRESRDELLRAARDSFQHRRYVLMVCQQGAGSVAVDGAWHRLKPGQALLVFPYQVHTYRGLAPGRLRWIFMTFESEVPPQWEPLRGRVLRLGPELDAVLIAAQLEWRRRRERSRTLPYWAGLAVEALLRGVRPLKPPGGSGGGQLLPRVHAWVHRPEGQIWRIKDLARGLGISEPHLRASFREEVGISLGHYLRRVRLARASALLTGTDLPVGEIARLCGYESLFSFSRSFRLGVGQPPSRYRGQCHQPEVAR